MNTPRYSPDLLVEVEGYIAEALATFANSLRSRGVADGLTPEDIESAIEYATKSAIEEIARLRRELPAWINDKFS